MKANLEKKKKLLDHFGYKKISFNNSQKNVKIKLES